MANLSLVVFAGFQSLILNFEAFDLSPAHPFGVVTEPVYQAFSSITLKGMIIQTGLASFSD